MMLLPLYVHPLVDPDGWESLAHPTDEITAIVNVQNGPGRCRDEVYAAATARLAAFEVPMLGYVDLDYATRAAEDVWSDIAGWAQYPVSGVFFDRAPSGWGHLDYVSRMARPVRGSVVLNPGTRCHVGYGALADLVCTFEGSWESYREQDDGPDWSNAVHLVYGVPERSLAEATELVRSRVHNGFVTDLDLPLPYAGLPPALRPGLVRR